MNARTWDIGTDIIRDLVEDPSAEAVAIDEVLVAYSEGDKSGALRLLGYIDEARRIRAARPRRKADAAPGLGREPRPGPVLA